MYGKQNCRTWVWLFHPSQTPRVVQRCWLGTRQTPRQLLPHADIIISNERTIANEKSLRFSFDSHTARLYHWIRQIKKRNLEGYSPEREGNHPNRSRRGTNANSTRAFTPVCLCSDFSSLRYPYFFVRVPNPAPSFLFALLFF